jgi:hypothetical protein
MNIYLCSLLVLLALTSSINGQEVQSGVHQPIAFSTGQLFETSTNPGDSKVYSVKFTKPFIIEPKVLLTIELLDEESTVPNGWEVKLTDVQKDGFSYSLTRSGNQRIYTINIRWFATIDSNINFYYYNLKASEFDNKEAKIFWPEGESGLPFENVDGAAFLLGVGWNPTDKSKVYDVEIYITDIDNYGTNIFAGPAVNQKETYFGDWISFVIAVANKDNF